MTETIEKAELKPMKRDAFLVGKVRLRDDAFKLDQKSTSGYVYSNLNFGVETAEGNVIYVEAMGGYAQQPLAIRSRNKSNEDLEINWADRLNPKIVEQVADYKLLKASLVKNEVKAFLSAYDQIAYLQSVLVDGMEVSVRATRKFSVYKGEPQAKLELVNIGLPYAKKGEDGEMLPTEFRAVFAQTILVDEDSLNITMEDEEKGETVLQAYAVDYIGKYEGEQIKQNALFPVSITLPIGEVKKKKIAEYLFAVEAGKTTEISVEGLILEGYDKSSNNDTEFEISEETQELIDLGLFTREEVQKKVQVRGNKVSKLLFTQPSMHKDENEVATIRWNKEKFAQSDMFFFEQAINGEVQEKEEIVGEDGEGSNVGSGSEDWMSALGI